MKQLNTYIQEKLVVSSEAADEFKERKKYFTCDNFAEDFDMPKWAYDYRKLKNGSKNRFWYAVVNYLYLNGPTKRNDLVKKLKPGNSTYAEFFTKLTDHNVITKGTGKDRGLQFLNTNVSEWINFVGNSYIS